MSADERLSAAWDSALEQATSIGLAQAIAAVHSVDSQARLVALMTLRVLLGRDDSCGDQVVQLAYSNLKHEQDDNCVWQSAILLEMCARRSPDRVLGLAIELCERDLKEVRIALGTTVLEYLSQQDTKYRDLAHDLSRSRPGLQEALTYCWA